MKLAASKDKLAAAFAEHHLPESDVEEATKVPGWFHNNMSRGESQTLTTHSQELLIALRDVAGLSWGGAEMSSNENCRQDSIGTVLQNFNFP